MVLAATIAQLGLFSALERRMKQAGGPGIIPFELAGTPERSQRIMAAWGSDGRAAARRSLLLDYLFPPTYGSLQALACMRAGDSLAGNGHPMLSGLAGPLAWSQLGAAAFDYVENSALLAILAGRNGALPALARRAALAKFVLIYSGWGYIALGGVAGGSGR